MRETFLVLSGEGRQFCALLAQKSPIAWEKQLEKAALQLFGFFSLFSVWPEGPVCCQFSCSADTVIPSPAPSAVQEGNQTRQADLSSLSSFSSLC